jgi:hypothetical protein
MTILMIMNLDFAWGQQAGGPVTPGDVYDRRTLGFGYGVKFIFLVALCLL